MTTAPERVTTRVLTTGDGVIEAGMVDDDSDVDSDVDAGAGGGVLDVADVDVLVGVCGVSACRFAQCLGASNLCDTQLRIIGHLEGAQSYRSRR